MHLDTDTKILSILGRPGNRKACLTIVLAAVALPIIVIVVGAIVSTCGG